jgi:hypothetical protein
MYLSQGVCDIVITIEYLSDEEVTLNVDGDESELYGRPQYPLYV